MKKKTKKSTVPEGVPQRVREARRQLKMTQEEFGQKIGVRRDVIANLELKRTSCRKYYLYALAYAHHISFKWLWTGEGPIFDFTASRNKDSTKQ